MSARTFRNAEAFRGWLEKHHARARELLVRCYKVEHSSRGLTYRDALDEALCFGWIDGIRRSLDDVSFSVRFTPRRTGSAWSRVNTERARQLEAEGRMQPPGAQAFAQRTASAYSFEAEPASLAPALAKRLRANARAWRFFEKQTPWYHRTTTHWIMSAKREETRERRLETLVECSARGELVPPLRRKGKDSRSVGES